MLQLTLPILESYTVTVTGEKPQDIIEGAAFFASLPQTCPFDTGGQQCGARLILTCRHPRKNIVYYGLLCQGETPHECNFTEYGDKSGIFWRGNVGKNAFKPAYGTPHDHRLDEREREEEATPDKSERNGPRPARGSAAQGTAGNGWNCSEKNRQQVLSLWQSAEGLGAQEVELRRMLGAHGCTSRKELTDQQVMSFSADLAAKVRELRGDSKGARASS